MTWFIFAGDMLVMAFMAALARLGAVGRLQRGGR